MEAHFPRKGFGTVGSFGGHGNWKKEIHGEGISSKMEAVRVGNWLNVESSEDWSCPILVTRRMRRLLVEEGTLLISEALMEWISEVPMEWLYTECPTYNLGYLKPRTFSLWDFLFCESVILFDTKDFFYCVSPMGPWYKRLHFLFCIC